MSFVASLHCTNVKALGTALPMNITLLQIVIEANGVALGGFGNSAHAQQWLGKKAAAAALAFFFCHCKLKRVQVPVPTAAYAASHASRTGREAAGLRSLLPASVCQELVQSWRQASSSKLRLEG